MVLDLKYKKRKSIIIMKPEEPVEIQINLDEIRLMRSFYGLTRAAGKKYKDEKENQRKFYNPID